MKVLDFCIAVEDFFERTAVVIASRCVIGVFVVAAVCYGVYQIYTGLR